MRGQRHAPAALPPGKTRYPSYRRLGEPQGRSGRLRKISPPTGIRSPDRPASSESLYRLSYRGPLKMHVGPCDGAEGMTVRQSLAIATFSYTCSKFYLKLAIVKITAEKRWNGGEVGRGADRHRKVTVRCHLTARRDPGESRGRWKSMRGSSKGRR